MESSRKLLCLSVLYPILFSPLLCPHGSMASSNNSDCSVHVGVILDLETMAGKRCQTNISTAIDKFYKLNRNSSTKVTLHFMSSSRDVLGSTSAAVNLLTNWDIQAIIIGPINPDEAHVIASLGNRAQIPIVSLAAQVISIDSFPFLIHANLDESSQAIPIAALANSFGWHNIVPIFEASEYNVRMISSFLRIFQSRGVKIPLHMVIPTNASNTLIETELLKLRNMQAKIFVTCMMPDLSLRFYQQASHTGLMRNGYAWIATSSFASMIETLGSEMIDTIQGLVGIRPYIPKSYSTTYPSMHDLLAYGMTWVIALAVEKLDTPCSKKTESRNYSTSSKVLVASVNGGKLLDAIQNTQFDNMGIQYQIVDRQLQFSLFEIINVVGGVKVRGFWSPDNTSNNLKNDLKPMIWPGNTVELPRSWLIKTTGRKLKIALPCNSPVQDCIENNIIIGYLSNMVIGKVAIGESLKKKRIEEMELKRSELIKQ